MNPGGLYCENRVLNVLPLNPVGGTTQPGDLPKAFNFMKKTSYTFFGY